MITIRQASLDDLDHIEEIERTSFTSPWPRRNLELELLNTVIGYYEVILLQDILIGYAGAYIIVSEAHINNVAIDLDFRHSGYGKKLMEHFLNSLRERGVSSATLEVREDNISAVKLYRSLGFNQAGVRENYYQDVGRDALIFWKYWEVEE